MKKPRFAICIDNKGNEASLILRRAYVVLPDVRAARDGLVRIIDESGEDYLFDRRQFVFPRLSPTIRQELFSLRPHRRTHASVAGKQR